MILTNQLKKYVKSLHALKFRQKYNKFIAEGPKICNEIIDQYSYNIEYVFCTEEWAQENTSSVNKLSGKTVKCKEKDLQYISNLGTANKILIVAEQDLTKFNNMSLKGSWAIYLDDIRDPGNMGTIIRIADWFNIKYLIASPQSVDFYNPKVVQSAMGGHLRVNLITGALETFNLNGIETYAMVVDGQLLSNHNKYTPGIIIIGNESKGISDAVMQLSNQKLTIKKLGGAESLNASVACGIACQMMVSNG